MSCNYVSAVLDDTTIRTYTVDGKGNIIEYNNDDHPWPHPGRIIGRARVVAAQAYSSLQVLCGPDPDNIAHTRIYYTGLNGLLCDWKWNENAGWHRGNLMSMDIHIQAGTRIQYAILFDGFSRVGFFGENGRLYEVYDEGSGLDGIDRWTLEDTVVPRN